MKQWNTIEEVLDFAIDSEEEAVQFYTRLAERVERAVVSAGLPAERRRFRAHLTLGRVRNRSFPSVGDEPAPDCPAFPVEEIVLFQSELLPSGAVYTPLECIPLRGLRVGEGACRKAETNEPGASQRGPGATDSP